MDNFQSPRLMRYLFCLLTLLVPSAAMASAGEHVANLLDLTMTPYGIAAVAIFIIAYCMVIGEEFLHLRKSKPVMVVAGIIWVLVSIAYSQHDDLFTPEIMVRHNILEYAELMLFLLAAMTYINTMEERNVFAALRAWLVSHDFSFQQIFWITGVLSFFISPIADNLTTALVMAAVVMAIGAGNTAFVVIACINIVVAANAGGAFSPFGDITTLMVWQKGIIEFQEFFVLFVPSVINWVIPAVIMSFSVPKENPASVNEEVEVKQGGYVVVGLFLFTIFLAVSFHNFFHLPPMVGMMTGLGVLKLYGYMLKTTNKSGVDFTEDAESTPSGVKHEDTLDTFTQLQRAEWDTLLFFYGVVLSVGGLGALGYLGVISANIYTPEFGITNANILVGVLSAIVDNIPVMFAVLAMNPEMSHGQWLLVTLTAGVGGSMLSIGSAAGVALMGQARGIYTFFAHLKWSWAIALGYGASIYAHLLINGV